MSTKLFIVCVLLIAFSCIQGQLIPSHAPTPRPQAGMDGPTMAVNKVLEVTGKPVARVNGAVLTDRDLLREMFQIFPYGQQHKGFPKAMEADIRRGALQMIIFEELVYQEAKRRGVVIPDATISQAEAQFRKKFASEAAYKNYLKMETGGSRQLFQAKIRRSMMIEKLLDREVRTKSLVTPAQLRAEYTRRAKEYTHGELIHVQSISIIPPSAAPDVLKEAKKRAEDAAKLAKQANSYRDFGLLAEKISEDDFHVNMGDHHELPAEQLPPPIVAAVKKMKPGDVSNLMQFGNNYTIFRLESVNPAGKTPFAQVKGKLKSEMQKENEQRLRSALAQRLRRNAKIDVL